MRLSPPTPILSFLRWIYRRFFWLFCCGVLLIGLLFALWLWRGAHYLIVETEISPSDVLIALGGGAERFQEAVNLYRRGYAPRVLFTGGLLRADLAEVHMNWGGIMRYAARIEGLPAEALFLEMESTSTYEDAVNTKKILEKQGWESAIVVSSIYHMRRARMAFENVYKDSGIRLQYRPAPSKRFNPNGWWKREDDAIYVVNEYFKMVLYRFRYF